MAGGVFTGLVKGVRDAYVIFGSELRYKTGVLIFTIALAQK
jgi:hypothetical protein